MAHPPCASRPGPRARRQRQSGLAERRRLSSHYDSHWLQKLLTVALRISPPSARGGRMSMASVTDGHVATARPDIASDDWLGSFRHVRRADGPRSVHTCSPYDFRSGGLFHGHSHDCHHRPRSAVIIGLVRSRLSLRRARSVTTATPAVASVARAPTATHTVAGSASLSQPNESRKRMSRH